MMENFFVTLVSDSYNGYHTGNTPSNFKNDLYKRIELVDEWEVALCELSLPLTLCNTNCQRSKLYIRAGREMIRFILPDQYHSTPSEFLKHINLLLEGYFILSLENDKLLCEPDWKDVPEPHIRFSGILARQLGFADDTDFMTGTIRSPTPVNVNLGLPLQFWVTSNIVRNQIYGDRVSQILRSCTFDLNKYIHGGVQHFEFNNKQYVPVSTSELHEVKIDIINCEARYLSFLGGTSVAVLHFRRCARS
jgi:hypothetical protein